MIEHFISARIEFYKLLMEESGFDLNVYSKWVKKLSKNKTDINILSDAIIGFRQYYKKTFPLSGKINYRIYESKEIKLKIKLLEVEKPSIYDAYQKIKSMLKFGENLSRYSSRNHQQDSYHRRYDRTLTYKDDLLRHWEIYHLHFLPQEIGRTKELLFVKFHEHNAYLIDIMTHSDFYNIDLLNIIDNNWSYLLYHFPDAVGYTLTDKQIYNLERNNVNFALLLSSGKVVMPSFGVSSSGNNMSLIHKDSYERRCLELIYSRINTLANQFYQIVPKYLYIWHEDKWFIVFNRDGKNIMLINGNQSDIINEMKMMGVTFLLDGKLI